MTSVISKRYIKDIEMEKFCLLQIRGGPQHGSYTQLVHLALAASIYLGSELCCYRTRDLLHCGRGSHTRSLLNPGYQIAGQPCSHVPVSHKFHCAYMFTMAPQSGGCNGLEHQLLWQLPHQQCPIQGTC